MSTAAIVAAGVVAVAAASPAPSAAPGGPVAVSITSGSITVSPSSAAAGRVSFVITNKGSELHEIDIVRTTVDRIPVTKRGNFNEHTTYAPVVKEAVKVQPHGTRNVRVRLIAGSYVLLDNLPGHFAKREVVAFTVT